MVATARAYVEESSDERIPMPEELSVSQVPHETSRTNTNVAADQSALGRDNVEVTERSDLMTERKLFTMQTGVINSSNLNKEEQLTSSISYSLIPTAMHRENADLSASPAKSQSSISKAE